ncbi:Ras subfamily protein [Acanthamoeba castellanii str. Neff]|uniref:Ras subfamily protein n=1 Tax=Acanthamoeba castellanii (strain ATCC 30010 / Neff) TaxID=1257118 RepID=L8H5L2_ACACF|nr:Ras subfamily protein [Acanthamoeba castellanii str. Neff]ELR19746.1 Ras subfamily protein [Acanthamoeba castellanii str. Neff]
MAAVPATQLLSPRCGGTVDFITALPPELSLHVLLFVPLSEVGCTLSLVSRAWKRFADDDALWRAAVAASALTGGGGEDDDDDGARGFKAVLKEALLSNPLRDTYEPQLTHGCYLKNPHELKVTVVGDCGVGKSALTIMLVQQFFVEEYDPTIEDNYRKMALVNGLVVLLDIMDTAGPEEFTALSEQWIRAASALLCVYSVTDRKSFRSVTDREAIEGYWPMIKRIKKDDPFSLILVGNKCDVDETATISDWRRTNQVREVTAQEGAALARKMSSDLGMPVPFLETSAKLNRNPPVNKTCP